MILSCLTIALMTAGPLLHKMNALSGSTEAGGYLNIGWASADITPDEPVVISGGSSARVSEGIKDPIGATVLLLESVRESGDSETVIMISVDLVGISIELHERIKDMVSEVLPEINVNKIINNATHTHTAPDVTTAPDLVRMHARYGNNVPDDWARWGIDPGVMSASEYVDFAAGRIAGAIEQAWKGRKPGGISYGLAHAVVGHNRLASYYDGRSQMGGNTNSPDFSHIEGYEDHSINLLYTWDTKGKLTGVIINVAIPSQVEYGLEISADYWHETRLELRRRLGDELFILPQCSAAGDQFPGVLVGRQAERRMEEITGRNRREQIAVRLADAVTSILPFMEKSIDWNPVMHHRTENLELSRRMLTEDCIYTARGTHHSPQVETVEQRLNRLMDEYQKMLKEFEEKPELKLEPRWYQPITAAHWRMYRAWRTLERYEDQKSQTTLPAAVHVIRIGDMVIATNPFELYLDFGMQMKARSKAVQTFIVQLARSNPIGGYVPTHRSVAGGAYGAIPESTQIGPEGGRELVEQTLMLIESLWD